MYSLYEGYLTNANPDKFGRYIFSYQGQSGSFAGYFKADENPFNAIYTEHTDKGYGMFFKNMNAQWSGYYKAGESFFDIPSRIKTFPYFDQGDRFGHKIADKE